MREQEKALARYDAVLPFHTAYEQINELTNQIDKIKDEESRIALKITQEEAQSKQAEQDLQQADERKLAAQETLRLRRPRHSIVDNGLQGAHFLRSKATNRCRKGKR